MSVLCPRGSFLLTNTGAGANGSGFHFLPGGALRADEDTAACAAREWQEETGLQPGPLRLVGVIESCFGARGRRQHEVGFSSHMAAPDALPDEPFTVLDNAAVTGQWVPFTQLEATPVYPLVLTALLSVPPGVVRHTLNREA
ncbi:NUDIX hydrolase [Deinococcus taeanensis]|uniref:NUDIX domain-containing protein n=1 Tax=Deinococcus taeanensis TaxID=2737050 RepID=UPI001CDBA0C5|nr:NUDIX hydrolase [Deinococcus taeanensis]UBV41428.1 NUDIX hydrolase [Deinococcus taeanensis]